MRLTPALCSAGEDLFVQAVTLGVWSMGILVIYARTRRLAHALLGALALSVAMQTRPEMLVFPIAMALVLVRNDGSTGLARTVQSTHAPGRSWRHCSHLTSSS